MKILTLLLTVCLSSGLWAQSLREANRLFEKYEYTSASAMYSELSKTKSLSEADYKKLAYSYFIVGDFKNCLPLSDSILNLPPVDPFFYYMNGESNFGEGNYGAAKASFIKYKSLDDEYNVEIKIQSCDLIRTEVITAHIDNKLAPGNNSKANITGEKYLNGVIEFIEVGEDSSGAFVDAMKINSAELVLARPFVHLPNENRKIISLDDDFRDAAITSFTLNEKTSDVWVTVARPLATEQMDKVPHVYQGKFNAATLSIIELERWKYSGYEDSSACAHATINESGNLIVFSKSGSNTNCSDLYQSILTNGEWGKPTPIAKFNTMQDEMYPQFMADSLLSFSSDGRPGFGGLDIYKSRVSNGSFGDVEHVSAPVNGSMDDFNFNYYADSLARYTSNRLGGAGDDDMYLIEYLIKRIPTIVIPDSTDFIDFVNSFKAPIFYFKFDKYDLNDNLTKITELISFLEQYPNSSILVEGNTDSYGTDKYNLKLSEKRAQSVKEALIAKGIKESQIATVGNGNSVPLSDCKFCTSAMHAMNRYARVTLIAK